MRTPELVVVVLLLQEGVPRSLAATRQRWHRLLVAMLVRWLLLRLPRPADVARLEPVARHQ